MPGPTFPFDFNPDSAGGGLVASTGNYTVPASTYARVTAIASTDSLTVDGTTVMGADIGSVNSSGTFDGTGEDTLYTNSTGRMVEIEVYGEQQGGGTSAAFRMDDGNCEVELFELSSGTVSARAKVLLADGGTIDKLTTGGTTLIGTWQISGFSRGNQPNAPQVFWAPTGTTVNGANKVISEYAE